VSEYHSSKHSVETCHECALRVAVPSLAESQKALCPRCGFVLSACHVNAPERILAFAITALTFLAGSLFFDFLTFKANGIERKIDMAASVSILIENGYPLLAVIEVITIFAIPAVLLLGIVYVLFFLRKGVYPKYGHTILHLLFLLMPWSMVEIFLIGVLVSLIKVVSLADINLGLSFYAYILFSTAMIATLLHMDRRHLFQALDSHIVGLVQPADTPVVKSEKLQSNRSVQHTWALIITSVILYIPANILPIMNTRFLGQDEPSTIIGGVLLLWSHGSYPIAAVIFVASILVPVGKIVVLAWLNFSVQNDLPHLQSERIGLYRLAEFVGRWSMVDVFVVIILVSLVQLGNAMSIFPGAATLAFSGVVVLTMLAAMSFDSTLIYDNKSDYEPPITS